MAASSSRAPAASSTARSLAPAPTSSIGPGTARMRAVPGSTAGARAPGRSLRPPTGATGTSSQVWASNPRPCHGLCFRLSSVGGPSAFPLLSRGCSWRQWAVPTPWVRGCLGSRALPSASLPPPRSRARGRGHCPVTDPGSLSAACPAAWAPAAGTAPSGGSQAGTGAARLGPLLCSSPRCWTPAATTTVSTPLHRREPLHLSPRTLTPQPLPPRPLCHVHLLLLAREPGGCGHLLAPPGQLPATSVVVSLC